ncbi:MAG: GTPase HflX [Lachnospiraceae bacterium]|nr:GTPase HflX [Lachnospiraceae bacterium]
MEKVILAGLDLGGATDFEHSMEELEELAKAADMEVVGIVTQKMPTVNKAFYIGTGKVEQVRQLAKESGAGLVVFDNALSPMQLRNLQKELETAVMDRTTLILEIFSGRARTREAKLQVEVASLQYMLPRLVGLHDALSRQGGASGSMSNKGAGEKKLELDRRHIEARLATLRRELARVEKDRETQRKQRLKSAIPLVSLVGYTNAGKSTVMNALIERYACGEEKKVLEKDMLFATLETTVRKMEGEGGKSFLLSDTVGFINELPHNLVKAFRSTLEEVKNADLLLHVIDYSDDSYREHMQVTKKTLEELGAGRIPSICVFNKLDLKDGEEYPRIVGNNIFMAAGKSAGIEELVSLIEDNLFGKRKEYELLIPYTAGGAFSDLSERAFIEAYEYREEGIFVKAALDEELAGRYRDMVIVSEKGKEG